jgi:Uma2 family endonuclease
MKILHKWSVEDYHRMIETGILDGKPVELLKGEIIEMSPEGIPHSFTNDSIAEYLREQLRGIAKVREAHPVTLDDSEPEPDISVVRLPNTIYAQHHPYAQDIYWLIEIANNSLDKDLNEKRTLYASSGIPEYWIVDLKHKKLWVFTKPQNDYYSQIQELTSGTITPLAFPNIVIEIARLLII